MEKVSLGKKFWILGVRVFSFRVGLGDELFEYE